jgi:HpcH/HpaI aldolase/citrate lyase family
VLNAEQQESSGGGADALSIGGADTKRAASLTLRQHRGGVHIVRRLQINQQLQSRLRDHDAQSGEASRGAGSRDINPDMERTGRLMETRLGRVWGRGEVAVNGWLSIPSTVTAEMVASQDYDTITVDLQHGLIDYQMALPMMQAIAAASDATVIARPPWLEPGIIMKLLDAGALGILCPMINTPADAEALVRATMRPKATAASAPPGP